MNIDPASHRYGQIVPWDSLTDTEQSSGQWIKLPATDENGEPVMAKRRSLLEDVFGAERKVPDALVAECAREHEDRMNKVSAAVFRTPPSGDPE